jgi:pimeloyl-ACP methyl ester carboxylesterase
MMIVLVHGNPEVSAVWNPLRRLLDRDDVITLSPPGFGVPASSSFRHTVPAYREWLAERLAAFGEPVDLVGHDWGGVHVLQIAMHHPELIRSWASDALGVLAPGFVWHAMAQVWQTPEEGEASVQQLFGGDLAQRRQVVEQVGITGAAGDAVAAELDMGMGEAVLSLLRSAAQPAMARLGADLEKARATPGLALIAADDAEQSNGTDEQHRWAAERAGAQVAVLDGAAHWWPSESPKPAADALTAFWQRLGNR